MRHGVQRLGAIPDFDVENDVFRLHPAQNGRSSSGNDASNGARADGVHAPVLRNAHPGGATHRHWLDSTHITFGVATIGASKGPFQLEGSCFNGREPDQYRWNIETRRFGCWSTRLSYNPPPKLSMQVSYGVLKSPEALEPDVRVKRSTALITYHLKNGGDNWATTLALRPQQEVRSMHQCLAARLAARVGLHHG